MEQHSTGIPEMKIANLFEDIDVLKRVQRLANQIEDLIKKTKINFKKSNGINNNSNIFYNGNDNGSKKSIIENSNISSPCRNSNKFINSNNLNVRINSEDRKEKIIRIISPKK